MPGLVVVVVEEHHVRESVVIIDDESEIDHCLIAFVGRDREGCVRIIGCVDVRCPVRCFQSGC